MILRPAFYKPPIIDRTAERLKLGLDPGKRTALMLFGGEGSSAMLKIARDLQESDVISS